MKLIIPMAGRGTRMRPHSITIPKPVFPIAGKSIVQRLVEQLASMIDESIDEIAYIIAEDFGEAIEKELKDIAQNLSGSPNPSIYYQKEALGTAHAILCAEDSMEGPIIIGFADTLFQADFQLDTQKDGVIYTHSVDDPSSFGVVKVDGNNNITDFVEKPDEPISDLAIIGIYYIKDSESLKSELQYLIDNDIKDKGEYQLTNALENMKNKGAEFAPGTVKEWLDCGNKDATVHTNARILDHHKDQKLRDDSATVNNSSIIEPCYIGPGTTINNAVVGPHVSIEGNTTVENSIIKNSILLKEGHIKDAHLRNSILGNYVEYSASPKELSLGDYSTSH